MRKRFKQRMQVWRIAVGMTSVINGLDTGRVYCRLPHSAALDATQMKANAAGRLAMANVLQEATRMARVRRGLCLTGVQSAAALLLKTNVSEDGYVRMSLIKQVPLIADRIVEPPTDAGICMLSALPPEDAL